MRKKIVFSINFFLGFFFLQQTSCIESKQVLASSVEQSDEGKLLFINLLFLKTAEGKDSCEVINSIVTNGTLKGNSHPNIRNRENYYTVFFNSCNGNTLYKEEIDNQLETQMEVHNENGTIELKDINFKQREYSIKMQKGKEKICRLIVTKTEKGQIETICNHLITL